ncbi:hypothetical protein [Actinomadura macrotermitis]|uniref:Uncharacterized protein n=1 Tax=Actinomadura macrotermitis TaxID=2585200 RepID=A0A7K0BRK7_9ACTN|nr:hypothetical protein [Actinomadura macrotermitis]MQY03781.1 hypothetical protein [Actinomadura macrotermitis]
MESHEDLISRRLAELAGETGPLRVDGAQVARRVRRRRRSGAAVAAGALATAGAIGAAWLWPGAPPVDRSPAVVAAPSTARPSKYCGAPRRTSPVVAAPQASEPPDQSVLDRAARTIDRVAGGGKEVYKGGRRPGEFARWYAGVEISNEWRQVTVYRLPNARLDAAICAAAKDVTVEIRDAVRSHQEAERLVDRLLRFQKGAGFLIFTIGPEEDGSIHITTDHPDIARKVLGGYATHLTIEQGDPLQALVGGPGQ